VLFLTTASGTQVSAARSLKCKSGKVSRLTIHPTSLPAPHFQVTMSSNGPSGECSGTGPQPRPTTVPFCLPDAKLTVS
jgi:hypothetical protein